MDAADGHPLPVLVHYDDGSRVEFWGYSGGAHALGHWGEITLAHCNADGTAETRTYRLVRSGIAPVETQRPQQ